MNKTQLHNLLKQQGLSDETLKAMKAVDRKKFVNDAHKPFAYEDRPLSIGYDVTISQPSLVGKMIDLLAVEPISNILELGTGSAYNAAIMSKLVPYGSLTTVERVKPLAEQAKKLLRARNTTVIAGNALTAKYPHVFDRIIVTAEFLDEDQMIDFIVKNAAIFCIAIFPMKGILWRIIKCGEDLTKENLMRVRFVPVLEGTI